jgi:hypothetical protein
MVCGYMQTFGNDEISAFTPDYELANSLFRNILRASHCESNFACLEGSLDAITAKESLF